MSTKVDLTSAWRTFKGTQRTQASPSEINKRYGDFRQW